MADRIANTGAEAPASMTLRFDLRGYDILFTVRDESGRDLLGKIGAVLGELDSMGAKPLGGRGNGHANGGERKVCAVHNAEMRRHEKDGQAWYSHKTADGQWCRGNAPTGGGQ